MSDTQVPVLDHTVQQTNLWLKRLMAEHYFKTRHDALEEALRLMQAGQAPVVAVVDTAGRLVGLITPENIGEMMMVRAARPEALLRKRRSVQGKA